MLLSVYLNTYQVFSWSWLSLGRVFLLALADELWISNLMLANNLCDAEEDESNHRTTIIHFIGKKAGLVAFSVKNVLAYVIKKVIDPTSNVLTAVINVSFFTCF